MIVEITSRHNLGILQQAQTLPPIKKRGYCSTNTTTKKRGYCSTNTTTCRRKNCSTNPARKHSSSTAWSCTILWNKVPPFYVVCLICVDNTCTKSITDQLCVAVEILWSFVIPSTTFALPVNKGACIMSRPQYTITTLSGNYQIIIYQHSSSY